MHDEPTPTPTLMKEWGGEMNQTFLQNENGLMPFLLFYQRVMLSWQIFILSVT